MTLDQLSSTWPGLAKGKKIEVQSAWVETAVPITPSWQNQYRQTIRLKPMKAFVKNFMPDATQKLAMSRKAKRPVGRPEVELQREMQESISLTATLLQHPFMPHGEKAGTYSVSVPGRHLKKTVMDLVKPWEYTARSNRLAHWESPKQKKSREADDEFGLELRQLSKRTGFPLDQCYEMYQRMGQVANTFEGFRDRETAQVGRAYFTENEWVQFLKRCGVSKKMVCKRIFHSFMHQHGFGRKKRDFLSFYDAVYCLCAFGIGKRQSQGRCLFNIIDSSGDGSVSRAELLKFMTDMLPEGYTLPKIVTFKKAIQCRNPPPSMHIG